MLKILPAGLLFAVAVLFSELETSGNDKVLAIEGEKYVEAPVEVTTTSSFEQHELTEEKEIKYKITYEKDPTLDFGEQVIEKEGKQGRRLKKFLVSFWQGAETSRRLVSDEITSLPEDKIIRIGTKASLESGTFDRCGEVIYTGKMRVWATSYDKNCEGCSGITYTGKPAGYGLVAVDPKIIPLHTRICIPGYGIGMAEDIGGAIKGNKIDLGFDDVRYGWWSARWTNIYILQ